MHGEIGAILVIEVGIDDDRLQRRNPLEDWHDRAQGVDIVGDGAGDQRGTRDRLSQGQLVKVGQSGQRPIAVLGVLRR